MKKGLSKLLLALYLCLFCGLCALLLFNPLDGEAQGELLEFFGRLHPALLHLPFGIVLLLVLAEVLRPGKRTSTFDDVIPFALGLAIATSVVAVSTGTLLAMGEGANEPLVVSHMRDGILFTLVLLGLGVLRLLNKKSKWLYRGGLAASVVLLVMASHQGGSLTHGSGYLTKHMPNGMRPLFGLDKIAERKVARLEDLAVFSDLIHPIWEQNCISCHNPDKLKGSLNLETYEGQLAGGKMGPAVVPFNLDESELHFRITLPRDDDESMPPEEKPPLSAAEVAAITWWIEGGAPREASVAALGELPAEVEAYIASVFSKMVSPQEQKRIDKAKQGLYAALGELKREMGILVSPVEGGSDRFSLDTYAVQKQFDDDSLKALEPYADRFVEADLSRTQITDGAVESLRKFENLKTLNLSRTQLTGKALGDLAVLDRLESLNLYGSSLDPRHLSELAKLDQLKKLYLFQTELETEDTLAKLRASLPSCEIADHR